MEMVSVDSTNKLLQMNEQGVISEDLWIPEKITVV